MKINHAKMIICYNRAFLITRAFSLFPLDSPKRKVSGEQLSVPPSWCPRKLFLAWSTREKAKRSSYSFTYVVFCYDPLFVFFFISQKKSIFSAFPLSSYSIILLTLLVFLLSVSTCEAQNLTSWLPVEWSHHCWKVHLQNQENTQKKIQKTQKKTIW